MQFQLPNFWSRLKITPADCVPQIQDEAGKRIAAAQAVIRYILYVEDISSWRSSLHALSSRPLKMWDGSDARDVKAFPSRWLCMCFELWRRYAIQLYRVSDHRFQCISHSRVRSSSIPGTESFSSLSLQVIEYRKCSISFSS